MLLAPFCTLAELRRVVFACAFSPDALSVSFSSSLHDCFFSEFMSLIHCFYFFSFLTSVLITISPPFIPSLSCSSVSLRSCPFSFHLVPFDTTIALAFPGGLHSLGCSATGQDQPTYTMRSFPFQNGLCTQCFPYALLHEYVVAPRSPLTLDEHYSVALCRLSFTLLLILRLCFCVILAR